MIHSVKPEFSQYLLSDEVVERSLRVKPVYFARHPELLTSLSIPNLNGTLFLDYLGELVGRSVSAHQPQHD